MINVSDNVKTAYDNSTTQVDKIILDGQEYRISNVEYYDDCYSEGNIFGTAIAKQLDFEIENTVDLERKEVEYLTGIKVNDTINWISLGKFIIQNVEPNDTTNTARIYAMDHMLKTNIPYISNLNYGDGTVTLLNVLQEVCDNSGIELATIDFVNSSFVVDSNQFAEGTLNKQVIQAVAQISGTVAKIKNDNKLYLINPNAITEVSKTFTLNNYKEAEIKRATHPINLVSLGMAEVEGENITLRDENSIENDGENSLVINDNPFAYTQAKREQLITALFNAVKGYEYKSYSFKNCQGLPYLETLDKIQFKDKEGKVYDSFIFRFNYKSPNGLESTIEAPSITRATVAYQNVPDALEIAKRTEIIVDKQNQKIEEVISEVDEQNQKVLKVEKTVDELNSKIQDIADITTFGESMYAKVELDAINESEPIQITAKPTVENISYLYPHENLFPSDDLYLKDRKIRFTNKTDNTYIDYILPDDLLIAPDGTYDEFYLGYDEHVCQITKRCQYNADGTVSKLEKEQITSYDYPKIELKDGDYTIELLGYTNAYLSVRLMAQNIYTTQFATKAEVKSDISQTAQEVNISVDKKLEKYSTTTEMRSEINATASAINLEVGKKVNNEDFTGANIMLAINNDTSSAVISADKIDIDGKAARFKTEINETYGPYTSDDIEIMKQIIMGERVATAEDYNKYDLNKDGEISSADTYIVTKAIANTNGYVHFNGTFSIDPYSATSSVTLYNNEYQRFSAKLGILNSFFNELIIGNRIDFLENEGSYISSKGLTQETEHSNGFQTNSLHLQDDSNWFDMRFPNGGSIWMSVNGNDTERAILVISSGLGNQTVLKPDGITTPNVTQTSLEESKKNFEKLENGLDIVKNTDIYKYNLKSQEDTDKKHIGFVIGDNYNYSQEITSQNNDGVDTYSMISVAYKAIQELAEDREKDKIILKEQQELIKQLQNEIKELKGEK